MRAENATGELVKAMLNRGGWHFSPEQIQFRNTVVLDLLPDEADLLASMKQKTRYNIRLAERKNVDVRVATTLDLAELYRMYAETAHRDGFVIRHQAYYLDLWKRAMEAGLAEPLIATVSGQAVAGVVVFRFAEKPGICTVCLVLFTGKRCRIIYFNGKQFGERRQPVAILMIYGGLQMIIRKRIPLWGVFRFKLGLGGVPVRYLGAWDLIFQPGLYNLYAIVLPQNVGKNAQATSKKNSYRSQSGKKSG